MHVYNKYSRQFFIFFSSVDLDSDFPNWFALYGRLMLTLINNIAVGTQLRLSMGGRKIPGKLDLKAMQ